MGKQREEGAEQRPDESINRNGAVRIKTIAIDEIAHALPERHHATETDERSREDLRDPGDVRVAGPSKPK